MAESVAKFLEGLGHEVIRLRDVLPMDSPDPLVAKVSQDQRAILISNDADFRKIAPRVPDGERSRFRKLSRIHLQCEPAKSAERMKAAIEFILFEYDAAQKRADKRIHIVIQNNVIKTHR